MDEDLAFLQSKLASLKAQLAALEAEPVGLPDDQMALARRMGEYDRVGREIRETEAKIAALQQPAIVKEADTDAKLAGELFTGATKPAAPAPAADSKKGCLTAGGVGIGVILVILIILAATGSIGGDDESASSTDCPASTESGLGDPAVQLISFRQSCPEETTTTATAGPSDAFAKPSEDDLPEGAILFSGTSAGPIGFIAQDGQSRFMSVQEDGVVVGNAAASGVATTWEEDGQITSFGARLSSPNPGGRYGINFFYSDTFEYGPGVAIEVNEQSAEYQWTPERDGTVIAGRPVVIIVGEAGNAAATGEYELEWWFVFQPD